MLTRNLQKYLPGTGSALQPHLLSTFYTVWPKSVVQQHLHFVIFGTKGLSWNARIMNLEESLDAQNFYLLKIHLNLLEISNQVLKFENLTLIWKKIISSENLFQTSIPWSGASMCIKPYHVLNLNTPTWQNSAGSLFEIIFRMNITFSNVNQIFKFQNSIWDFK